MPKFPLTISVLTAFLMLGVCSIGAASVTSTTIEAESGVLGADWAVSNNASPAFVTITTANTSFPGSASRVATYNVTFPAAGMYQLYARVQVGPDTFNNDSLFYGSGFGTKSPANGSDWILVNGLGNAGFTNSTEVVTNGGMLGGGMWKWVNLSQFTGQPGFTVDTGSLTQTFQIGGRETNLLIDKFVFGSADDAFTVSNLDNGTDGTPPPATAYYAAPLRRPVSPSQPMLLVHIDTWNYPDPQKIIDLIPQDIRPYVVMNISLSISHDSNAVFKVVQYGYETAKSWIRTCAENNMWCMVQQASGGMHHFSESDLSVYEEFFRDYPNFLGFNYAEQFWGFDDPTDPVSADWTDRINHFADLLALSSKYGGYLVVSWCGNQYDPNINPIAMLKRNSNFATACRKYSKNYILEEKYTQQSYQSDMESVCLGAYLSGYSGQYGIRYDSTGWTDASGSNANFTLATGGAPHLEHIMLTGETVIDGPELIWQQDIQSLSNGTTSDGYTTRSWGLFPQYQNVILDIFRKILDGTVRIPTRQEVINRTKVAIISDVNSGSADNMYSSPQTLFEGLYRMDGDGDYQNNKYFFKKAGRYPTIPTVYQLLDTNAQSFQLQVSNSLYSTRWPTVASKTNELNTLFSQEYTGDLYAGRYENAWVVYNPYKSNLTASASIPLKYNTCDHVDLTFARYTSGVMKEYSNSIAFYLCNYDNTLDTSLKTDTITIYGSTNAPSWSYVDRGSHQASMVASNWSGGVFTLTIQHNGSLDITINCAGTGAGRLTSYTAAKITAPTAPLTYIGAHQYEAECFDYRNISGYVANGYGTGISNYTGQGYLNFGTGSSASIKKAITVLDAGTYRLDTKYAVTEANISSINLYVNGSKVATPAFTQTSALSDWAVNEQYVTLNAGANTIAFTANGTGASPVYFDNMVVVPTIYDDGIVIQENGMGFIGVDGAVDNTCSGYTGSGYASPLVAYGAGIDWDINFDSSATKSMTFRYASTNASTADLLVNGINVAADIQFPSTGTLTNWDYVAVYPYIPAGTADVRLQFGTNTSLPFIDYMEVTGGWAGTQPPNGLTAATVSTSQINLSWSASSDATSYNVKRSTTHGGPYAVVATGIDTTNFNDAGLVGGTTYYYVVSAVSVALGEGLDSGAAAATTLPPILSPLADSYVESGGNAGVNYGASTNLLVKNNVTLSTRNTYLMFDVHGLANASSATLTLMPNRVDDSTVKMYYTVASTNWTEVGLTWDNQPSGMGMIFATNTVAAGVPDVVDVTSAVRSQATNGGLLSIEITQPTNSQNGLIQFCSKEHPTNNWRPMLTYTLPVNTPPTLAAISNRTINAGVTLVITNSATDNDVPAQTLAFSLTTAPTNAVIDPARGVLTWRPLVAQAGSTNQFTVMVADNGTPSLSATNSFIITVNPASQPVLNSIVLGSQVSLSATGMLGPDYLLFTSTNLVSWQLLFNTNPAAMPVSFTDTNRDDAVRFYRLQLGP